MWDDVRWCKEPWNSLMVLSRAEKTSTDGMNINPVKSCIIDDSSDLLIILLKYIADN